MFGSIYSLYKIFINCFCIVLFMTDMLVLKSFKYRVSPSLLTVTNELFGPDFGTLETRSVQSSYGNMSTSWCQV